MKIDSLTPQNGFMRYLLCKLWAARLIGALIILAGAVSAYPSHRSFVALFGGIFMGWILVWFGGEIERTSQRIKQSKAEREKAASSEDVEA